MRIKLPIKPKHRGNYFTWYPRIVEKQIVWLEWVIRNEYKTNICSNPETKQMTHPDDCAFEHKAITGVYFRIPSPIRK